jgi:hypothetical protein
MRRANTITALACLAALAGAANAGEVNLEGLQPGKHVSGPDLKEKDLTGKLVLVVIWGVH